jgi:hypothetical protein
MGKLKVIDLNRLPSGKHHDGDGLYFDKKIRGASWMFKFTLNGLSREMGLGRFPDITLAKARELAGKARSQRAEGIDPIAKRDAETLRANKSETFDCLKFTLEGSGERSDGNARTSAHALACRA